METKIPMIPIKTTIAPNHAKDEPVRKKGILASKNIEDSTPRSIRKVVFRLRITASTKMNCSTKKLIRTIM
tara:strand:+ start:224 stop:436 length:213 start_codon:yes stop_codon:yes gene_type:complete